MPKTDSKGFVENAKSALLRFHQSVERFLDQRIKKASAPTAIAFMLLAAVLFTILRVASSDITILKSVIEKKGATFIPYFLNDFLWILFFLIVYSGAYWFICKQLYKIKNSFWTSIDIFAILLFAYSLISILGSLSDIFITTLFNWFQPIYLSLQVLRRAIMLVFFAYAVLTILKALHGGGYKRTIGLVILLVILTSTLLSLITVRYFMFFGLPTPQPSYWVYNITNHNDGSLSVIYAYILNSTNQPKELCDVSFPKGWKMADESNLDIVINKLNYTIDKEQMEHVFYKIEKSNRFSFVYFYYGPAARAKLDLCPKSSDVWFDEGFNADDSTWSKIYETNKGNLLDVCKVSVLSADKSEMRYEVVGDFIDNKLGFDLVYQAPCCNNTDLQYVLNNIRCYQYN